MAKAKYWTEGKIKKGFERFKSKHGRLPTAPEVDKLGYLPSSRFIQKAFGGLEHLRRQFGYQDSHFGRGSFRSVIARRVNNRGRNVELYLEKILQEKFGEVFVHTEKVFGNSKNRVDFYVYSPEGNFGIDVFFPGTLRSLQTNINIKINKYCNFTSQLFFVVANNIFKQEDLDAYTNTKTKSLPRAAKIVTLKTLFSILDDKKAYPNPIL